MWQGPDLPWVWAEWGGGLTDGKMSGSFLRTENMNTIVGFLPDQDHGSQKKLPMWTEGGDYRMMPGFGPGSGERRVVLSSTLYQWKNVSGT